MKSTTRKTLDLYWRHTRKYKKNLWTIYPLMVVAELAESFISPLIVSVVLDRMASGELSIMPNSEIALIVIAVFLLQAFGHITFNSIVRIYWRMVDSVLSDLNMTVFNHLQKMSFRFFADRFAGSIVSQTNKFVGSYERLIDAMTWTVFKLIISVILTTIILFPRAPLVSVAILAVSAIYIPIIWIYRKRQIPFNKRLSSSETLRTGQLADSVANIVAVKSFSNEGLESARMQERTSEVFDRSMDVMRINMRQEFNAGSIQRSINVIVILISVMLAVKGLVQVGTIYLALTFTTRILIKLWDLNKTFRNFSRVFGDATDMTEILNIKPEVADPENPIEFAADQGSVDFENVLFQYADERESSALFKNLNLNIKPGEKIGLIGPSGGGKTTITKLLLRFMDIQNGTIKIDGQDISAANQSEIRKSISYVPQEPLLFHRSISENIAYGKLDAHDNEILAASIGAHADEFVQQLPEGYETLVGERGVKLSGGQKQRIAIARAMLKDAPILVLDEATSALDSESEQLIQDALWKLMEGKTAIVIAHRLSTIQKMDRIIVLDEGKIVEEGKHSELIKKKNGLYARLWKHQSGGFLQD